MDSAAPDGLGRDVLNAAGANLVALVTTIISGFVIGDSTESVLAILLAVYGLLIAFYARIQTRKGLKRRGVLACYIAVSVVIVMVMNLNIA